MRYSLSMKERALNFAWRIISQPCFYKYARRFDMKSLFGLRFSAPDQVLIEVTNHCNIRCIMCGRTYYPRPRGYMSFDLYRELIDQLRVPLDINHFGLGEPLLHKHIVDMIRYSSEHGMRTQLVTNGTLLTPDISRELIRAGLSCLWVSIDGATDKTYEKIRPGAKFKTVVGNIESFNRLRNELGGNRPFLGICTVPMVSNIRELVDLARLGMKLGVDQFEVHRFADARGDDPLLVKRINAEDPFTPKWEGELSRVLKELEELSKETGLTISMPCLDSDPLLRPPRRCAMPFTYPLITWEGYMTPCFCYINPAELNVGNLNEKPFFLVWNSRTYREFRETLLSSSPLEHCMECKMFKGISQLWSDYREI